MGTVEIPLLLLTLYDVGIVNTDMMYCVGEHGGLVLTLLTWI